MYLHILEYLKLDVFLISWLSLIIPIVYPSLLGNFDDGKSFNLTQVTKWDIRRRLVYVCKFATNARPSRGNLRQVFNFLIGGKCIQHLDAARDE